MGQSENVTIIRYIMRGTIEDVSQEVALDFIVPLSSNTLFLNVEQCALKTAQEAAASRRRFLSRSESHIRRETPIFIGEFEASL